MTTGTIPIPLGDLSTISKTKADPRITPKKETKVRLKENIKEESRSKGKDVYMMVLKFKKEALFNNVVINLEEPWMFIEYNKYGISYYQPIDTEREKKLKKKKPYDVIRGLVYRIEDDTIIIHHKKYLDMYDRKERRKYRSILDGNIQIGKRKA